MRTLLTEQIVDGQILGRVYLDRDREEADDLTGDFLAEAGKQSQRFIFYQNAVAWMNEELAKLDM